MSAIRSLLSGAIDYAGLFPPAALSMREAARNYSAYRIGSDAWALGRFIVPAERLDELVSAASSLSDDGGAERWRISALLGAHPHDDITRILAFNHRHASASKWPAAIDTVELKATAPADIAASGSLVPSALVPYVEIPIDRDPAEAILMLAQRGGRAKVRTGGVRAEQFPATADLVRFIGACARADLPFKATAGLHHPIRAEYRLTYEPDSASGMMYGFLNVFLVAAFLRFGLDTGSAEDLLEEVSPAAICFNKKSVEWRARRLTVEQLREARTRLAISFGSCSFAEPLDDLRALGIL